MRRLITTSEKLAGSGKKCLKLEDCNFSAIGQMNGCRTTGSGRPTLGTRGRCIISEFLILKRENDNVMKEKKANRSKRIICRLTPEELAKLEKKWKASTCRKLSDYIRHSLFDKPIITTYRNSSQDDLMAELTRLRNELNNVGNNFNQVVKKMHTLHHIPEFRSWLIAYEIEKNILANKVDDIRNTVKKLLGIWLQ